MDVKAAKKAVIEGFRRTDESLLQESTKGNWQDGATAVCVWILGQTVSKQYPGKVSILGFFCLFCLLEHWGLVLCHCFFLQ